MANLPFVVPVDTGTISHQSYTDAGGDHYPAVTLHLPGAGTPVEVGASNPVPVSLASLPTLAAGTNNIGDVDVLTLPVDYNSGAAGASTLRSVLATRHEAAATPLSLRLSDGSGFITNLPTNLAQYNGTTVGASNAIHVQPGTSATFTLNTRHEAAATPLAAKGSMAVFNSDLTVDTAIYQAGDSLCSLLTVTNAVLVAGETATLDYIHLVDVDDEGAPLRIYFFDRSVTLPANNAVWNVSDADMKFSRAMIQVLTGDWSDAGGNRTATFSGLQIPVRPNSGTSIFMGVIVDGTPTFAAATDLNITIGFKY